jgi:hydroxymethylpyrimidine pyrophosphatase-like HAD family hydrolase
MDINGLQIEWQEGYSLGEMRPVAVLVPLRGVASEAADALDRTIQAIPGVSATRSGFSYIEVRPAGSNKASGLAVVAERLGISRENILAIGDNDNDVEMLRWAGVGVSVQGASGAAIEASDFVCSGGAVEGANQVLAIIRSARRAARGR